MIRSLFSSATGMQSQQMNLDVIANNLANVNTTGFKKSKIEFQDLLYENTRAAGSEQGAGNQLPTGVQVGHGSRAVATSRVFTTGELVNTGQDLDIAISGDGFFEVTLPDGTRGFTRDGAFKVASDGRIITSDGLPVLGFLPKPPGTKNITISAGGDVTYTGATNTNFPVTLTRFNNPGGLEALGRNLFKESPASGPPESGKPSENGFGELAQGFIEMSNVNPVSEMTRLIEATRSYESHMQAIKTFQEVDDKTANYLAR